ncbi:MAG: glycosyltransferase [Verrucomicrobiota bacterium]
MAKRVCVLQDYLRMGGTERNSLALCNDLARQGATVTLLTARPGGILATAAKELGIQHCASQFMDLKLNWFPPKTLKKMDGLDCDQVILMGRVANEFGWRIKDQNPDIELIASIRTGRTLTKSYQKTLQIADSIWVNSQYAADRALALAISQSKIKIVENFPIHQLSRTERLAKRDASRKRLGVNDSSKKILLKIAAFRPGKCHEDLIRFLIESGQTPPTSSHWELWLVGSGSQEKRCQNLVRKLGMEEQVRFFGNQLDVSTFYYAADLAISASREESNSNFIQEAIRVGLPVLAIQAGGTSESVNDAHGEVQWVADFSAFKKTLLNRMKVES